jgi:hypothetical protein
MNFRLILVCGLAVPALLFAGGGCASFGSTAQKSFNTPDAAVHELVAAIRAHDMPKLKKLFGPAGDDILSSGDPVSDRADADRFLALYDQDHRIHPEVGGVTTLEVGSDAWPFPVPIVRDEKGKFVFDTDTGREEILNRRIGRNELSAEQVCLAIVDAQREYVTRRPMGGDLPEYAKKLVSDAGKKNGLYWPTAEGEDPSPLGPLVASATTEGYVSGTAVQSGSGHPERAFHGYRYRLLSAQGPNANGGAGDYLVNGKLIGGFGVVAYPAQYGNSGIMTFITNHDGVVFQRDLGPDTEKLAQAMTTFDPGPEWTRATDEDRPAEEVE